MHTLECQSLAAMFLSQAKCHENKTLFRFFENGTWQAYTWNETLVRVRELALGLLSMGVKRGDRVAIFSNNRVEWNLIDWANICIGALTVPIYSSSPPSQVFHILSHAEPAVLFVESRQRLERIEPFPASLDQLLSVVIEGGKGPTDALEKEEILTLEKMRQMGRAYGKGREGTFEKLVESIRPEDDLTIIYTSGTTGEPKGVLTTHAHYLFMIKAVDAAIPSTDNDVTLHFLPSAHSLGRLEHFMAVARGWTLGYARSIEAVAKDLRIIRPTVLFSVPRIYEIAYNRIRSRVERANIVRRSVFNRALSLGRKWSRNTREGKKGGWALALATTLVNHLIFSEVHVAFGGRLRVAISGGAPLSRDVAEFFHALGVLILEGYGLTETSTVSHVNRPDHFKFGTVGLPLQRVDCRISDDGEILLRGPNIFKGYYRDFIGTQNAIDVDGWFHTGDIGEIDSDGFLCITDRKKDLIVTSGGKKVAPQKIENLLKSDPLISQVMVVGGGEKQLMALITLDHKRASEVARQAGIEFASPAEMASHPWVLSRIKEIVREKNQELAPFEAVRQFSILTRELTVEDGELTPTLKLRRQIIMERYKELIAGLYLKG